MDGRTEGKLRKFLIRQGENNIYNSEYQSKVKAFEARIIPRSETHVQLINQE